jgi:hypothetical protein
VCSGDIIAVTDDDAVPRADWLQRIHMHFSSDPGLGAVGGRDWVTYGGSTETGSRSIVGKVQWFGRVAGNHHLGEGVPREVDFLKGANMSFRKQAIGGRIFDPSLRGAGAQPHNDMAFTLAIRRAGWGVRYDPAVAVDHYPGVRGSGDVRASISTSTDATYNLYRVLFSDLSVWRRSCLVAWNAAVGTPVAPGLAQLFLLSARGERDIVQRWRLTAGARRRAQRDARLLRAGAAPRSGA